jgi:glutathione S-transferase
MQLIGMLDSPYVRRVAVSLLALDLSFTHRSISVFRQFDAFKAINPVVKAPTLVCDDGTVLMDSTLILQYAEALARPRTLVTSDPAALAQSLHLTGLALAACEKGVQLVYERALRPPEKRHAPWVERVTGQLQSACAALEQAWQARAPASASAPPDQAAITVAVSWRFLQDAVQPQLPPAAHPALQAWSQAAEAMPIFARAPHGDGTVA